MPKSSNRLEFVTLPVRANHAITMKNKRKGTKIIQNIISSRTMLDIIYPKSIFFTYAKHKTK